MKGAELEPYYSPLVLVLHAYMTYGRSYCRWGGGGGRR